MTNDYPKIVGLANVEGGNLRIYDKPNGDEILAVVEDGWAVGFYGESDGWAKVYAGSGVIGYAPIDFLKLPKIVNYEKEENI